MIASAPRNSDFNFFITAVLAAAAPEIAPFMADECLMSIPGIEGIDYSAKEYLKYVQHIRTVVDRLNAECPNTTTQWNPHRVELALWSHYVTRKHDPSLLDDIPDCDDATSTKENGNSEKEKSTNGSENLGMRQSIRTESVQRNPIQSNGICLRVYSLGRQGQ